MHVQKQTIHGCIVLYFFKFTLKIFYKQKKRNFKKHIVKKFVTAIKIIILPMTEACNCIVHLACVHVRTLTVLRHNIPGFYVCTLDPFHLVLVVFTLLT